MIPLPSSPQVFSAGAAIGSLFTAIFTYNLNHNNYMQSIRPELSIDKWETTWTEDAFKIKIGRVENVGKGPLLYLSYSTVIPVEQRRPDFPPSFWIAGYGVPFIAPGKERDLNAIGGYRWNEVDRVEPEEHRMIHGLKIEFFYYDIDMNRYTLTLDMGVHGRNVSAGAIASGYDLCNDTLAPGLVLYHRDVTRITKSAREWKETKRNFRRNPRKFVKTKCTQLLSKLFGKS